MTRNVNGVYTLPPGINPVVSGTLIDTNWANPTMTDIANAITESLDRNGRGAMLAPLILSSDPVVQPFQATSKAYVDKFLSYATGMPIAAVTAYSANGAIPPGWLLCDGQAVSRTTYAELFAAIGTVYGAGDGSTTFNVPNLTNEFIRGFGAGRTLGVAQNGAILAHAHGITDPGHSHHVVGVSESNNASHTHEAGTLGAVSAGNHTHTLAEVVAKQPGTAFTFQTGADATMATVATNSAGAHTHSISGTTSGESGIHKHSLSIESQVDATGITITQTTGGGENIPRNMPMFYIIKALKDGTATITPVLAISSNDTAMISIVDTDPTVPVLNIHSNVPFGIPKLDANGKVPLAQIPNLTSNNLGFYDAASGNLPSGTFASGDTYTLSVGGTLNVFDPVTLVQAPTALVAGTDIVYITGSPTNPTGWYSAPLQTNVVASSVAFTPEGTISAGNVQAAIAELDTETQAQFGAVGSALAGKAPSSASTAVGTSFAPAGTIAATNVQAAIQELDSETQANNFGVVSAGDTTVFPSNTPTTMTNLTNVEPGALAGFDPVTGIFTVQKAGWYSLTAWLSVGQNPATFASVIIARSVNGGANWLPLAVQDAPTLDSPRTYLATNASAPVYAAAGAQFRAQGFIIWQDGQPRPTVDGANSFSIVYLHP